MMAAAPELASFLITRRSQIEAVMASRLGPAAPGPGAPESEVLRRFRSFAASALHRGAAADPALDGLRASQRRTEALLEAWSEAAAEIAGPSGSSLRQALEPLIQRFRISLRQTATGRRSRGAPRTKRRAVMAAIDRISDVFLAVDADSGLIVDANPAAGALLGVARDALLGVDAMSFVPESARSGWQTAFDALTEGSEPPRFPSQLQDAGGTQVGVECCVTRHATRDKTLALVVARPA